MAKLHGSWQGWDQGTIINLDQYRIANYEQV